MWHFWEHRMALYLTGIKTCPWECGTFGNTPGLVSEIRFSALSDPEDHPTKHNP
jgi:hypothetical protein